MGFASVPCRFAVRSRRQIERYAKIAEQGSADKLAAHALKPGEFGGTEEVEYGWSGGRHIFDGQFSFDHNVFNDALCFALRIDTNKVPVDMKKAYQIMEEEAVAASNPSASSARRRRKPSKMSCARA